jgi:hypothetical protein
MCSSRNIIIRVMNGAYSTHRRDAKYRILVAEHEGKEPLEIQVYMCGKSKGKAIPVLCL